MESTSDDGDGDSSFAELVKCIQREGARYAGGCSAEFDSVLCWPPTPGGGLAVLPCFSQLNGIKYDTAQNASRRCLKNGEWDAYSDYSSCRELPSPEEVTQVIELTTTIYFSGYSISLVALAVAVYIFCRYKDLRCLRNNIHMNLMLSYICADSVWILTFLLQIFLPTSTASCVMLIVSLHYFNLTNFFWMFVEGLYLYILVVKTFRGDKIKLPVCAIIGWGVPAIFVVLWGIAKGVALYTDDQQHVDGIRSCPWSPHSLDWIYQSPAVFILFVNVVFLVIIMWVLITKLRSSNSVETQQYLKAAKALLVLIPLLGVTYIVVLIGPTEGISKNIYECIRAVLLSTQGFTVAVLYCFLNTEVKNTVGHHLKSWHTHRNLGSQRNRLSSRDWSPRSRESIRLYQAVNLFKKRESSCSVGTTTSLVAVSSLRTKSQNRVQFSPPNEVVRHQMISPSSTISNNT